ncbi:CRISPR-associated endonuclease Cas6 [Clostridium ihumii]|uniref:CRISPR-associated endonuclease Cas6 n=1 Tax=Clostridium ihumii TaxID=1470356 RepID=UPI000556AF60|nr:CRISPR-associated endonuclease Cas6 [Clostridium ihumii]
MNVNVIKVTFEDLKTSARFSEKLRGFLGNKYKGNTLLHNHCGKQYIYRYPLVQYKVIRKTPMIIGINEAIEDVFNIGKNDDEFLIDGKENITYRKKIIKEEVEFGCYDDYINYKFLTPWIALNQKKVLEYEKSNLLEKEEILKKVLIGNLISMSKGLNYTVDKQIKCWINLSEKEVMLKGIKHIAFVGEFKTNFIIPDYLGIGKSVSRGFGTVEKQ